GIGDEAGRRIFRLRQRRISPDPRLDAPLSTLDHTPEELSTGLVRDIGAEAEALSVLLAGERTVDLDGTLPRPLDVVATARSTELRRLLVAFFVDANAGPFTDRRNELGGIGQARLRRILRAAVRSNRVAAFAPRSGAPAPGARPGALVTRRR